MATVRIDDIQASTNLKTVLKAFDAVVVGPGPGHPAIAGDVGLIDQLWRLEDADLLPIFGICLGFQSLCLAHGAEVKRLRRARHGIVSKISHRGTDIFEDITDLHATQYHSLRVELGDTDIDGLAVLSPSWKPTAKSSSLCPLAWDMVDEMNGPVLMSVKHTKKPFWGVQFHPESICTSPEGKKMMQNWWRQAEKWLAARQRHVAKGCSAPLSCIGSATAKSLTRVRNPDQIHRLDPMIHKLSRAIKSAVGSTPSGLLWARHTGRLNPVALVEALNLTQDQVVLLDSQGHSMSRFSILGILIPDQTVQVTYKSWNRTFRYSVGQRNIHTSHLRSIDQIWPVLQAILDEYDPKRRTSGYRRGSREADGPSSGRLPHDSPFWGGFMGYISYEAGLETINVTLHESCASSQTHDINFAFIHRSVVIDHATGQIYVQSLSPNDQPWIADVGKIIESLVHSNKPVTQDGQTSSARTEARQLDQHLALAQISPPPEPSYRAKVLACQSALAAGNSYELCLTDETLITIPMPSGQPPNAWALYKKLRRNNPAPFGAFLRLSGTTVAGTSPERFLRWSRSGACQFRPIKGTVKKGAGVTREAAHAALNSSKERAENLMIVDLIRHDVGGVVGAANCSVDKLMVVEEYAHVYQLVSVIDAQLPAGDDGLAGLDVLKASLPPGSMTGAPKKRSCEILREIERRPRGVYSGVLGYLDVGGAGDFSVVIRSAVCDTPGLSDVAQDPWVSGGSNESSPRSSTPDSLLGGPAHVGSELAETWRIGAGGAVTIQSTDEGEYLEMEAKVMTALAAFQSA